MRVARCVSCCKGPSLLSKGMAAFANSCMQLAADEAVRASLAEEAGFGSEPP